MLRPLLWIAPRRGWPDILIIPGALPLPRKSPLADVGLPLTSGSGEATMKHQLAKATMAM